jgi:spore coat protein A
LKVASVARTSGWVLACVTVAAACGGSGASDHGLLGPGGAGEDASATGGAGTGAIGTGGSATAGTAGSSDANGGASSGGTATGGDSTGGTSSGTGGDSAAGAGGAGGGSTGGTGGAGATGNCIVASGGTGNGGSGGFGFGGSSFGGSSFGGSSGSGGVPNFATPLPVPSVLAPTSSDATSDSYALTIRSGSAQMRAGAATPIVGYNGVFPGPTFVAMRGRTAVVTQTNSWNENVSTHNHGHKVAATSDGHPIDYIAPGGSKTYTYPNDQPAGTYWYHDHAMDLTGPHVYAGLAGFYIIKDPVEDALNLPSGVYDVPLLIQDKSFNFDNTLLYDNSSRSGGFKADFAVVNGVVTPHFDVATHRYRFRLLNAANARMFRLALSSGRAFQVIASDGGLLATPVAVTSLNVAPAERYDLVIDFGGLPVGTNETLLNTDGDFPRIGDLLQFRVTSQVSDTSNVPCALATITRFQAAQAVATRQLTFQRDNSDWTINGVPYDPARVDVTSQLDRIYIWELQNQSDEMHPFHKHLSSFFVLDIDGRAPPPEQQAYKDTVAVPSRGSARIIFKNETFTGTYVFHCHILEHEDHRMMLQESVTP